MFGCFGGKIDGFRFLVCLVVHHLPGIAPSICNLKGHLEMKLLFYWTLTYACVGSSISRNPVFQFFPPVRELGTWHTRNSCSPLVPRAENRNPGR